MQSVFLFQLPCYLLTAVEIVFVRDTGTVGTDAESHNMNMVAVDVGVFHYYIRYIGKSHLLHILVSKLRVLHLAQTVVGMGIKGNVHHRFLGSGMLGHPPLEILESPADIDIAGTVIVDFVGVEDTPLLLVYLLAVIYYRAVE